MDSSREQLRAKLIEAFTQKLDETLGRPTVTMTDIEGGLRPACEKCKVALAKDRMRGRHVDSLQGWIWYERMRYRCHECEKTYFPLDEEMELGKSRMSLQKESQLALLSVHMTYADAKEVYEN